jgi:hypothetical protein
MERLNMFITTNQEPLKHYYRNLVDGHDGPSGSREVPEEVIVKVTTHMHAHIYPNLDKITSALDASEHAEQSAPLRAVPAPLSAHVAANAPYLCSPHSPPPFVCV